VLVIGLHASVPFKLAPHSMGRKVGHSQVCIPYPQYQHSRLYSLFLSNLDLSPHSRGAQRNFKLKAASADRDRRMSTNCLTSCIFLDNRTRGVSTHLLSFSILDAHGKNTVSPVRGPTRRGDRFPTTPAKYQIESCLSHADFYSYYCMPAASLLQLS